jgi:uncharacterized protein YycO
MNKIKVIYGANWLPFSVLIRVVTFSRWSHCGLISECGQYVYESTFLKGVQRTPLADFKQRYKKTATGQMFCVSTAEAYRIAESKIGDKYDFLACFGILFKTGWGDASAWLCSEYVAHCSQLFSVKKQSSVTPEDCFRLTH